MNNELIWRQIYDAGGNVPGRANPAAASRATTAGSVQATEQRTRAWA